MLQEVGKSKVTVQQSLIHPAKRKSNRIANEPGPNQENRYHDSPLEDNYGKKLKTLQKEWREICQSWQTALEAEKQYAQATQKVKQNNRVALPARRKQDVTKNNYQPQTFRGPTLPASALSPGSAAAAAAGSLVTAPFWGRAAGAMTDAATRATGLFLRGSAPGMVSAGGS